MAIYIGGGELLKIKSAKIKRLQNNSIARI
jgi:hypothetical protein